jgi:hypothetical protein
MEKNNAIGQRLGEWIKSSGKKKQCTESVRNPALICAVLRHYAAMLRK